MSEFPEVPNDPEAEIGVLCSFMMCPTEVGSRCAQRIVPAAFHSPTRRDVYEGLLDLWTQQAPIDVVSLISWFRGKGTLENVGGSDALFGMFTYLSTAANIDYHLDLLSEKYASREVIRLCCETMAAAVNRENPQDLIDAMARNLGEIGVKRKRAASNHELAQEMVQEMEDAYEHRGNPKDVLRTGFHAIDSALGGGLRNDDYVLLTGPTKSGKSALAQNIAESVWTAYKRPVLIFSLEMGRKSYAYRIFSSIEAIPLHRMRSGFLAEGDFPRIAAACGRFSASEIFIRDDIRELVPLVSVSRQMKAKYPNLALIVVDYVQLIQRAMAKGETREQVVAGISTTLRNLQLELGVPVIILAQENDSGAARESRRLEQDCTLRLKIELVDKQPGVRTISVPLARNGPPCAFRLAFRGELMRFENCKQEEEP